MRFFLPALLIVLLSGTPLISMASHPSSVAAERQEITHSLRSYLRSMTAGERKEWKHTLRSEIRQFQQRRQAGEEADVGKFVLTLLALILPPLAVYLHQGEINSKFWISLLLTLLIWIPGVVYALLVIFGLVQ